jgi:hypothetical protein
MRSRARRALRQWCIEIRSRISAFLNKGDAEHIRAEQQRETTNGKGEIDLIHGDLSETAPFRYSVPNLLSQNYD